MCTVVYLPLADGAVISSNRDERFNRLPALPPAPVILNKKAFLMPLDGEAGGSWIALGEHGGATVLFNGAHEPHTTGKKYRKSRGLVFKELVQQEDVIDAWHSIELHDIEPFTIIHFQSQKLWQLIWEGVEKFIHPCNPNEPYLWSSCTLYNTAKAKRRRDVFTEWVSALSDTDCRQAEIVLVRFLNEAMPNETEDRYVMNRGHLGTVSITTMQISGTHYAMNHYDLQANQFQQAILDARLTATTSLLH